ncbi:colicin E3/pyocin S6 family cytotoxin [Sphingomonas gei]
MVGRPNPCFLDECEALGFVHGSRRWRSFNGKRLYTWDYLHGAIEVFTSRGVHLGAADALTGIIFKPAVKGRKIDV